MKPIKVCVYKKSSPVYVKPEKIEESFQDCHLLIYNLTVQQKDMVLELLNTFGDIVKHQMER
jgi:hypothetical protein